MGFLIQALSLTDAGPSFQHHGAQCYDKKYLTCVKIPKHEEYDACVDITDIIYVEECKPLVETICHPTTIHHESHVHVHISSSHEYKVEEIVETPKCFEKVTEVCHKVPQEEKHTECKKITEFGHNEKCHERSE